MKIAISTASSYSNTLKYALESVGQPTEILNSWGLSKGLKKIVSKPNEYKALMIQWPEALLSQSELFNLDETIINDLYLTLEAISKLGIKIVYTFHNLFPHEFEKSRIVDKNLYKSIIAISDIILHHSNYGLKLVFDEYSYTENKKNIIFRHPPYYFVNDYSIDVEFASKLNLDKNKKYFLSIGTIAKYKNIELFLKTLEALDKKKYGFIIAGKCYDNTLELLSNNLNNLLKNGYDIKLINRWLSDFEISNLVQVSSYLICNNSNGKLTSGIPHLCEAGGKILYSDIKNEYLMEISKKYTIQKDHLGNNAIENNLLESAKNVYYENSPKVIGERLAKIISS